MPSSTLEARLPAPDEATADLIFERFVNYVEDKGLTLYPAQEEALLELMAGKNVILNTPTGSGKSLVATALHFKAMAEGRRSFYTCPIKALVSEKFFALCDEFGAESVGMMTGDASINRDAPIVCCTAEILANIALREGERAEVDYVIMDEFHYYSDRERGVAWQVPLLTLRQATFLLMSATLGDTRFFETELTSLTGRPTAVVKSTQRPVPLSYEYRETPLHETVEDLIAKERYPIYLVNFTQRSCAEEAQNLMSTNFSSKEEKQRIAEALRDFRFDSPYGKEVQKFIRHGIGLHHAGLLPKYRLLVEKLSQQGLLKIICGTDTLGVGVNIPIRTVLFTKLCKYDGEKTAILSVRDFKQISGRAGRKGFDDEGFVVVQAPEHVIENLRAEARAAGDPAKLKKIVRKKPPEKGYVHWDRGTFERLVKGSPEQLKSRFEVSHGMLLNLLQSDAALKRRGGYGALIGLVNASHGDDHTKRRQRRTARLLFRSLLDAGIVELVPRPSGVGKVVRLSSELQSDFSLNQTLSLYLLETLDRLDPASDSYALDVVTLVESILEDPEQILAKQLDTLKTRKLEELKAQGVEYEERIAELEKLEYPKPLREFVYATFNEFAARHPWIGQENIRPKSVVREMFELYASFDDYVREYDLHRSEGLLLRYLSDVYKTLVQTVPEPYKTDEVLEIIAFLRGILRRVDSSLVDEWESLLAGDAGKGEQASEAAPQGVGARDVFRDPRAVVARVRSEVFRLLKALALKNYEEAAKLVRDDVDDLWTPERFEEVLEPYFEEYGSIRLDREARGANQLLLEWKGPRDLEFRQSILDPQGDNLWVIEGAVRLNEPRPPESPLIEVHRIGT